MLSSPDWCKSCQKLFINSREVSMRKSDNWSLNLKLQKDAWKLPRSGHVCMLHSPSSLDLGNSTGGSIGLRSLACWKIPINTTLDLCKSDQKVQSQTQRELAELKMIIPRTGWAVSLQTTKPYNTPTMCVDFVRRWGIGFKNVKNHIWGVKNPSACSSTTTQDSTCRSAFSYSDKLERECYRLSKRPNCFRGTCSGLGTWWPRCTSGASSGTRQVVLTPCLSLTAHVIAPRSGAANHMARGS